MSSFPALVLRNTPAFSASVEQITDAALPSQGDVRIRVQWSGINYKDALALTNKGKIIRGEFPFVPGIDLAGIVESSSNEDFKPGDRVLSTGWGLGENIWGGYSTFQCLPANQVLRIPDTLSSRDAMIAGTAGLTALLAVMEIEKGPGTKEGPFLVTGATGGVGSFSVLSLSQAGFAVTASTGKQESHDYLKGIGATEIIDRNSLSSGAKTLLDSSKWSGCVDSVGSTTLEAVISQTARHGTIATCGLAGGAGLQTSVFPFILRGVRLIGIDSNTCPNVLRIEAWKRIGRLSKDYDLDKMAHEVDLKNVVEAASLLMEGKITGRIVVKV